MQTPSTSSKSTVLIVDRDADLAQITSSFLTTQGFRVVYSPRLSDAMAKVDLQRFQMIVLDPDLGAGEAGESLLPYIRKVGSMNFKTPVVFCTGNESYLVPASVARGVAALVRKPFSFPDLLGALASVAPARSGDAPG